MSFPWIENNAGFLKGTLALEFGCNCTRKTGWEMSVLSCVWVVERRGECGVVVPESSPRFTSSRRHEMVRLKNNQIGATFHNLLCELSFLCIWTSDSKIATTASEHLSK